MKVLSNTPLINQYCIGKALANIQECSLQKNQASQVNSCSQVQKLAHEKHDTQCFQLFNIKDRQCRCTKGRVFG